MKKTIKEVYNIIKEEPTYTSFPLLFSESWATDYPVFDTEITDNFVEDYNDNYDTFDKYFVRKHGKKFVDFDAETQTELVDEWREMMKGILRIYLDSWARLYYTLHINYNPVFNVEEHTTSTYGEHETEDSYGQDLNTDVYGQKQQTNLYGQTQKTNQYGQKQTTNGQRTDDTTNYEVAYDSGTEKEKNKSTDVIGSQTITENQRTDTETGTQHTDTITNNTFTDTHTRSARKDTTTSGEHVDTVDRMGNIGVVSAMDLIKQEEEFRRKYAFFDNVFLTVVEQIGAYYDCESFS